MRDWTGSTQGRPLQKYVITPTRGSDAPGTTFWVSTCQHVNIIGPTDFALGNYFLNGLHVCALSLTFAPRGVLALRAKEKLYILKNKIINLCGYLIPLWEER